MISNTKINTAGKILKNRNEYSILEIRESEDVLTSFRAIHLPAINSFQALLRKRILRTFSNKGFVAQRLKRAPSIINKLTRNANMKLSTMQDVAGVRAIMPTLDDTLYLSQLISNTTAKHKLIKSYDYINNPKDSGYRSIHHIFEYSNTKYPESNGLKIEVQIRSKLQHTWATSVETLGTFLNMALKASEGEKEILDFFKLTSISFAILENAPSTLELTDTIKEGIFKSTISDFERLKIRDKLNGYSIVADKINKGTEKNALYYLVTLNTKEKVVSYRPYRKNQFETANKDYTETERAISAGAELQVVLVSTQSVNALKQAYPNYFLDTREFIKNVEKIRKKIE